MAYPVGNYGSQQAQIRGTLLHTLSPIGMARRSSCDSPRLLAA
jgi:hypothetical protein